MNLTRLELLNFAQGKANDILADSGALSDSHYQDLVKLSECDAIHTLAREILQSALDNSDE